MEVGEVEVAGDLQWTNVGAGYMPRVGSRGKLVRQVYGRSHDTQDYALFDSVAGVDAAARMEGAPKTDVDTGFQKTAGPRSGKEARKMLPQTTNMDAVDVGLAVGVQRTGSLSWQRRRFARVIN